ncbi:MAG: hypothetical protein IT438_11725 [Phycisphaerales bacterium]|nr:hypothetical protein [Phycisphaerales bacterium]
MNDPAHPPGTRARQNPLSCTVRGDGQSSIVTIRGIEAAAAAAPLPERRPIRHELNAQVSKPEMGASNVLDSIV